MNPLKRIYIGDEAQQLDSNFKEIEATLAETLALTDTGLTKGGVALTSGEAAVMRAGIGATVYEKMAALGRSKLTMTGIGNSIMYVPMPWWSHACQQSNGKLSAYDSGHGVPGDGTSDMLLRMASVPSGADIVVIQECTNDAFAVSAAVHAANMRGMIEFFMGRGQLPVISFPPPRSDGDGANSETHKLGMIDYFLAVEYKIPCVFPWRQFTTLDVVGGLDASAGSVDSLHPGNAAHALAGTAMLAQLLGNADSVPLPYSSNTYGGIGLFADAINLAGAAGGWTVNSGGGNGALSLVSDASAVGNWVRATSLATASFQFRKDGGFSGLLPGDELMTVYKIRSGGTWVSGYAQLNPMQIPGYVNGWGGSAYLASPLAAGIVSGQSRDAASVVQAATTQLMVLCEINAPATNQIDIAQLQVWNKSAIFR